MNPGSLTEVFGVVEQSFKVNRKTTSHFYIYFPISPFSGNMTFQKTSYYDFSNSQTLQRSRTTLPVKRHTPLQNSILHRR